MPIDEPALLSARGLGFAYPGRELFKALSFDIRPGLTLVQGGDGRGKTTLLNIIAGHLAPQAGAVVRHAPTVFDSACVAQASEATESQAWLQAQRAHQPAWSDTVAAHWAAAFALTEHLAKPLFMLSTGSRRKLGLVAAAASGAPLTLLDCPYAALDAASCRVLGQMLHAAAQDRQRAWVVADCAPPPGLLQEQLAGCVNLGD